MQGEGAKDAEEDRDVTMLNKPSEGGNDEKKDRGFGHNVYLVSALLVQLHGLLERHPVGHVRGEHLACAQLPHHLRHADKGIALQEIPVCAITFV